MRKKNTKPASVVGLIQEIRQVILSARNYVARNIDTVQVLTNYEIGHRIVEHEQKGSKRAEYGKEILKDLSEKLTAEFGRGFSEDNLSNIRKFYMVYREQKQISETASGKLLLKVKRRTMRQAIDEGFILDVLKKYTTYKTYYKLIKTIEDDPKFLKKKAAKRLSKFLHIHPVNVHQKTEVSALRREGNSLLIINLSSLVREAESGLRRYFEF